MDDIFSELTTCKEGEHNVFCFLTEENLRVLTGFFQRKSVKEGEFLWEEGAPCDYAAFIVSGEVEVKKQTEFKGKHVVVGIYKKGAVIGALCILNDSTRAVTAVALDDVVLATITRENLDRLIEKYPELGSRLLKGMLLSISIRLRKSFERLATFF